MTVSQDNSVPRKFRWQAPYTGLVVSASVAAVLVAAGPAGDDGRVVVALALAAGLLCGLSHAYRLNALLIGLLGGLCIAGLSSVDFLTHDVAGKFMAVAATVAVYLLLGLVFGGFAECVRALHRLTHGRGRSHGGSVPK